MQPIYRPEADGRTLYLKAKRKPVVEGEDAIYLINERPTGSFYRGLRLPDTVDIDKIQS